MKLAIVFLALLAGGWASGGGRAVLRTLPELRAACNDLSNVGRPFDVEASVLAFNRRPLTFEWLLTVGDGSCSVMVFEKNDPGSPATNLEHFALNDRVRLRGALYHHPSFSYASIGYKDVRLLRHQPVDHDDASPHDLFSPGSLYRTFRFTGVIKDAFRDESDANYVYMAMNCQGETIHLMMLRANEESLDPSSCIGAEVTAAGFCANPLGCQRRQIGRMLILSDTGGLTVSRKAESNAASIRSIDNLRPFPLSDIPAMGRIKAEGTALATWHGDSMLLKTVGGNIVKVQVEGPLPAVGQAVQAIGLLETDLYFLNLVHATWKPSDAAPAAADEPTSLAPRKLLTDEHGRPQIQIQAHGTTVQMTGIARYLSPPRGTEARLDIEADGFLVPVDASSTPELLENVTVGCMVSVTGVCVLDIGTYGLSATAPKARGFFVVPRSPSDVVVLSRPPWWTPGRLLAALGVAIAAMLAILVWNRVLNHVVERRSRQLFKAQIARTASELRVEERTRLAIELHDAMSQNISSAALHIDAAERHSGASREKTLRHLKIAAKTLLSCREELHNCIWDLRSQTLDDSHIDNAIRRVLAVSLGDINLSIRFNVPRQKLSDSTVHLILKTIRELATNAVRHGKATAIKIAGSLDNDYLRFSVADNGTGFDVDSRPGVAEGHFGLQGAAERARRFGGEMSVSSSPGNGARVMISLRASSIAPKEKKATTP